MIIEKNALMNSYPVDIYIHQVFERQAEKTPGAIAVVFENNSLTYQSLNQKANQLAYYLRMLGVGPDVLVGIYVERSLDMIIALLGILKAGGAYVPLDPIYPHDRLSYMLEDAHVSLLLTQKKLQKMLSVQKIQMICLDGDLSYENINSDEENKSPKLLADNLAYVIYTSGSTGRPKGTAIPHRALSNFISSMLRQPGFTAQDVVLGLTSLSFDMSILELLLPLTIGACVEIISRELAVNGVELAARILSSNVSIMQATPTTWRLLLGEGWVGNKNLRMLCGGEALTPDLANQLLARGASLSNMYGPTETTIWSSMWKVDREEDRISIGIPIDNTYMYVLNDHFELVLDGEPGELYIGGEGLARGYLHRPALSAEKFLPDPFNKQSGTRMYRTGDLGRRLGNGNLEFLGRVDHQLKLRGYRIDLGEIEVVLLQHPFVHQAVVVTHEDESGEKRLVSYIVPEPEQQLENLNEHVIQEASKEHKLDLQVSSGKAQYQDPQNRYSNNPTLAQFLRKPASQLRHFLGEKLPDYMIPSNFVILDALPLTLNEKVDRKVLSSWDVREFSADNPVIPRSAIEEVLVSIWADTFSFERFSIYDSFLELGGHSLLAARIVSRIREAFQMEVPVRTFFELETVARLASYLEVNGKKEQRDVNKIAQLLLQLNQLSDDEVKEMLAEKSRNAIGRSASQGHII